MVILSLLYKMELSNSLTVSLVWRNKKCFNKVKRIFSWSFPQILGTSGTTWEAYHPKCETHGRGKEEAHKPETTNRLDLHMPAYVNIHDACSMCIWCILNWSLHQTKFNVHMFPDIHSKTSQLPRNISMFSTPLPLIHWFQRVTGVAFVWNVFGANLSVSPWRNITAYTFFAGTISVKYSNMCVSAMENIHQFFIHTFGVVKFPYHFNESNSSWSTSEPFFQAKRLPLSGTVCHYLLVKFIERLSEIRMTDSESQAKELKDGLPAWFHPLKIHLMFWVWKKIRTKCHVRYMMWYYSSLHTNKLRH